MQIFNTHLEFNREKLFHDIDVRIAEHTPGYVCVCDSSVLTRIQHDLEYRKIIKGAFINTCEGSSICTLANKLYGPGLESINGPMTFAKYTHMSYKQVIIIAILKSVGKNRYNAIQHL